LPIKWLALHEYDNSSPRDPAYGGCHPGPRGYLPTRTASRCSHFFAAAVLLVQFRAAPQNLINELAVLFRIVRVACVLTYIGNRP